MRSTSPSSISMQSLRLVTLVYFLICLCAMDPSILEGSSSVETEHHTLSKWSCVNKKFGCSQVFDKQMAKTRHAKNCQFGKNSTFNRKVLSSKRRAGEFGGADGESIPKRALDQFGCRLPISLGGNTPNHLSDATMMEASEQTVSVPTETFVAHDKTAETFREQNDNSLFSGVNVTVDKQTQNKEYQPEVIMQEESMETIAEELAEELLNLHGKKLSYRGIEKIVKIVTKENFTGPSLKSLYHNVYSLRKYSRELECRAIEQKGLKTSIPFQSCTIEAQPTDYPGAVSLSESGSDSGSDSSDSELDNDDDEWADVQSVNSSDSDKPSSKTPYAKATLWYRDPVLVLEKMISEAVVDQDLFIEPKKQFVENENGDLERFYSHPMGGDLAVEAFEKLKLYLQDPGNYALSDPDNPVVWFEGEDGWYSMIGGLLIYTDKRLVDAKSFYPVHICLINFSTAFRQKMVKEGKTVVGFLPTHILQEGRSKAGRLVKQIVLHKGMDKILSPLSTDMERGRKMKTKPSADGKCKNVCIHSALVQYVTDIPEGKDIMCARHSNSTAMPCAGCLIPEKDQNAPRQGPVNWRSFEETKHIRSRAIDNIKSANAMQGRKGAASVRKAGENELKKYSLTPLEPFFNDWSYVDGKVHRLLDAHRILGFERMHSVLGLVSTIFTAAFNLLSDSSQTTPEMVTAGGISRPFSSVKSELIEVLNAFTIETDNFRPMPDTRLNFTSRGGFFNKDGVTGMLQATHLLGVLPLFPFMGAILDRSLGMTDNSPLTKILTLYSVITQKIYSKYISNDSYFPKDGFTESEVRLLEHEIAQLKTLTRAFLGAFQKSAMGTNKGHTLDHVGEDLRRLASFLLMSADIWESSHILFKSSYQGTSKRDSTWMEETINRFARACQRNDESSLQNENPAKITEKVRETMIHDAATLSENGSRINLGRLAQETVGRHGVPREGTALSSKVLQKQSRRHTRRVDSNRENHTPERKFALEIGAVGLERLANLIDEMLNDAKGISEIEENEVLGQSVTDRGIPLHLHSINLIRETSGRLASHGTPDVTSLRRSKVTEGSSNDDNLLITIRKNSSRDLETLVASSSYYSKSRYDNILVELEGYSVENALPNGSTCPYLDAYVLHPARAIAFLRIPALNDKEWVFVQYYEVANKRIEDDPCENVLNCIRLKWAQQNGQPMFDLLPLSCVRSKVYLVCGSTALRNTKSAQDSDGWEDDFFYINRYYAKGPLLRYDASAVSK